MKPFPRLIALASVLSLATGCSTPITATDAGKVAVAIGHVPPSRRDTCETQKALAAQSSRIDTIVEGKEVVYKAPPCDTGKPPPKTS
ncbi:MAG: hypothetical protein AB1781_11000 [Pseudomonadota bacterium]